MKKKVVLGFGFIGFVVLLFLFLGSQSNYYLSPIVAKNIQYPYSSGDDIYFYTGHGFAKYNVRENKSTALTEFINYPEVSDVSISEHGAVFKTAGTYLTDDLYYYLQSRDLPTDSFYWWMADFKTGKTSLVAEKGDFASEILSVVWAGPSLIIARQVGEDTLDGGFELYKQSGNHLKLVEKKRDQIVNSLIWADDDEVIYSFKKAGESEVELSFFNFNNKTVMELPREVGGSVAVSKDGQSFAYQVVGRGQALAENSPKEGLYFYKKGFKEPKLIMEGFVGTINSGPLGAFLVSGEAENKTVYGRLDETGKLKTFNIDEEDDVELFYLLPLQDSSSQIAGTDDNQNLYILSKDKNEQFQEVSDVPIQAHEVTGPGYRVSYFESSDSFTVLITKNPYKENVGQALARLKDLGLDTNQHVIRTNFVRTISPDR